MLILEEFIEKQIAEYDIGMRHLANMMGEDPDNFSQKDADVNCIYFIYNI